MARRAGINPFYGLLVIVGVAFVVTACGYGILTLKGVSPGADTGHPLLKFLDRHGALLLGVELGLLAAASVLAMATDGFWARRATSRVDVEDTPEP